MPSQHTLIQKQWDKISKKIFTQRKWKYSGGFIFKRADPFLYLLTCLKYHDRNKADICLSFKHIGLDELFWEITGLTENNAQEYCKRFI